MTVFMTNKYDHELRKRNVKRIAKTEQNNIYIDGEIFSLDLVTTFVIYEDFSMSEDEMHRIDEAIMARKHVKEEE